MENSSILLHQLLGSNRPKSNIDHIEDFLKAQYDFRYNLVTARVEFKQKGKADFEELSELAANSMYLDTQRYYIGCKESVFFRILNSDFVQPYDPFSEYFKKLTWDGNDYISQLANTVATENQAFWNTILKKWLVAVVAGAISDNPNHSVLVLSGAQGIGKTTWLENLLPKSLKGYIHSGSINPHHNDTLTHLYETLFINLDELENLNHYEQGNLKEVITKKTIRQRRPYARFHTTYKRRASFMGSINDSEFLTDVTGNRRYLCFTAENITKDHGLNMDNVYAQAYHLFKEGENGQKFRYWFDSDEIKQIEAHNEDYRRVSIEEELVKKYFLPSSENLREEFMTPTEILYHINDYEGVMMLPPSSLKRIGQVMQKMGFRKKSMATSKPYRVFRTDAKKRARANNGFMFQ
jgi:predicted P-loop ATPase